MLRYLRVLLPISPRSAKCPTVTQHLWYVAGEQLGGCAAHLGGGCAGIENQPRASAGKQDTAGQLQEFAGLLHERLLPLQVSMACLRFLWLRVLVNFLAL